MFKKSTQNVVVFVFAFFVIMSTGLLPAEAAGKISIYGNATRPGNNVNLGYMIVEVPPGALANGDTMALTLPEGFSFNSSEQVLLSATLGSSSESTVSVVYPSISGKQNAVDGIISAKYQGKSTLKIAVDGNPLPNENAILYIYMKGIKTPSNYRGEVVLKIDSNGGWPNSFEGSLGYDYKNDLPEEKPSQVNQNEKTKT